MCGICGWLNVKRELNLATLERMNNVAKHRGPDDEGYLIVGNDGFYNLSGEDSCKDIIYDARVDDKDVISDAFLGLAHRRLSILDLSSCGHQPMLKDDYAITFNGEVYNFIEIRRELEELGIRFSTNSDTEVILKAYIQWGEECINRFNGMWSFAIWDGRLHKLFCSRDRLGVKPFYYYLNDNQFVFGSEIKQLCENPKVPRILDENTLVTQVIYGISDYSEDTLIKDIKSLLGGWNLVIEMDETNSHIVKCSKYQYWDINVDDKSAYSTDKMLDLLHDAVNLRTRSDAEIGVMLSGGVDSSCITADVARIFKTSKRGRVKTFTSSYRDFSEGDESAFAHLVNKHCDTDENIIYTDDMDTYDLLEKVVWHLEGEINYNILGNYQFLREISKTGVKVLISGQGADETQFGYERYYAYFFKDLLKRGKILALIKSFKLANKNSKLTVNQLIKYSIYFSSSNIRKVRCYKRMKPYITKQTSNIFKNNNVRELFTSKSLKELIYNEIKGNQLSHNLRLDDRLYMAHSLECRLPFVDYRYIEEAVKVPEEMKIDKGYTKYLIRSGFEKDLPSEVIWRINKMGWETPGARWASRFDDLKIEELFKNSRLKKYFDVEQLRLLYKKDRNSYPIQQFIIAELFTRLFRVESA